MFNGASAPVIPTAISTEEEEEEEDDK